MPCTWQVPSPPVAALLRTQLRQLGTFHGRWAVHMGPMKRGQALTTEPPAISDAHPMVGGSLTNDSMTVFEGLAGVSFRRSPHFVVPWKRREGEQAKQHNANNASQLGQHILHHYLLKTILDPATYLF